MLLLPAFHDNCTFQMTSSRRLVACSGGAAVVVEWFVAQLPRVVGDRTLLAPDIWHIHSLHHWVWQQSTSSGVWRAGWAVIGNGDLRIIFYHTSVLFGVVVYDYSVNIMA